jgi:NAD(P)-dependent dehydrogenase (short-subunit alcohol dehydrogenase family)
MPLSPRNLRQQRGNLTGFFRMTQLAIQHMLAQGGGHVFTSSLVDNANSNIPSVLASLTKGDAAR